MKTYYTSNRTKAQDLLLLAHKFQDSTVSGAIDIRDILLALAEAGLTLSLVEENDVTADFALQLLENPTLTEYDPSMEVLV
jgi:hypothetical protein